MSELQSVGWFQKYKGFAETKDWKPTQLSPTEEEAFKKFLTITGWFKEMKELARKEVGHDVADDYLFDVLTGPDADYDYRGAWKAGATTEKNAHDGRLHWPSWAGGKMLKSPRHETAWKEFFMQETGKDPDELGLHDLDAAARWSLGQGGK